jgi:hypothetical protein
MTDLFVHESYSKEWTNVKKLSSQKVFDLVTENNTVDYDTNFGFALKQRMAELLGLKVSHGEWSKQEFIDSGYPVEELINVEDLD